VESEVALKIRTGVNARVRGLNLGMNLGLGLVFEKRDMG
jgi:hypothetical protein